MPHRMFDAIDHLGIAVAAIDPALVTYRETFGMELVHREEIPEHGIEVAVLEVGTGHVELVAPLSETSSLARFLAERGPGLHHVAYRVADIDATLDDLRARHVELLDEHARRGVRD